MLGLSPSFPINYTCYQFIDVGKYCTLCAQMLDAANWNEATVLFTFLLWSKAMIQIYILGAWLIPFKEIKHITVSYCDEYSN